MFERAAAFVISNGIPVVNTTIPCSPQPRAIAESGAAPRLPSGIAKSLKNVKRWRISRNELPYSAFGSFRMEGSLSRLWAQV